MGQFSIYSLINGNYGFCLRVLALSEGVGCFIEGLVGLEAGQGLGGDGVSGRRGRICIERVLVLGVSSFINVSNLSEFRKSKTFIRQSVVITMRLLIVVRKESLRVSCFSFILFFMELWKNISTDVSGVCGDWRDAGVIVWFIFSQQSLVRVFFYGGVRF